MATRLQVIDKRCGTCKGVRSNSKEVMAYDADRNLVRTFASYTDASAKAEKYLGIKVSAQQIRIHCMKKTMCQGKYYFETIPKYAFDNE